MNFELLVATRYLRAKRKQTGISVITFISILGVAAGVAALVVALAVSEGQRHDIQERLLGTQAHITVLPVGGGGITNYLDVVKQIDQVDGVVGAAPHAERGMVIATSTFTGVVVAGIFPEMEAKVSKLPQSIVAGNLADLKGNSVAIGKELAMSLGLKLGDQIRVLSPQFSAGPGGRKPNDLYLTIVAMFSIGLYEYDRGLVYIPFDRAQYLLDYPDAATHIEVKVRNLDDSDKIGEAIINRVGPKFGFDDWKVRYRTIFQALKLERLGMAIAISLIVFVASLTIVSTLTMMVMEKTRDIAILMAMGATLSQIRRVFIWQGVIIGVMGTSLGLVLGHVISYVADKYRLISLNPDVYSISFLPLRADLSDSIAIALSAILISFLATLYPSAAAAKLQPVESLRYE